jgi:negative regulator of sigma E activity
MEQDVTRNIEEQLSAFLDGELQNEELQLLVRRLERDDAYRATLVRYSLIGNILRKDSVQASAAEFRLGIMAAIDEEPAEIQPAPAVAAPARTWLRPLAAAAAAVVVIVGLFNLSVFDTLLPASSIQVVEAELPTDSSAAAQSRRASAAGDSETRAIRRASIDPERMTSYFVSHGEYSHSFQGPMGDSRIFVQQARFEQ